MNDISYNGRTAIVSGKGVCLGDAQREISVEEIRDNIEAATSLETCQPHDSGADVFGYMAPLLT